MARDPYHPRSVFTESDETGHYVVDNSYAEAPQRHGPYPDLGQAQRVVKVRQATIKGAITRRSNKAKAGQMVRNGQRVKEAAAAGVTYGWLREKLTEPEADAWLGMED